MSEHKLYCRAEAVAVACPDGCLRSLFTGVQVDEALHVEQVACEELFFWPKVLTAIPCLSSHMCQMPLAYCLACLQYAQSSCKGTSISVNKPPSVWPW